MMGRSSSVGPWAKRIMAALLKRELPPRWLKGAFSTTSTRAPASAAEAAEARAAFPDPTTTTSNSVVVITISPCPVGRGV